MASFAGLKEFELTAVQATNRELGHGSFATVIELDYQGLKCAGKKIHEVLKKQGNASYSVRRFEEECHLLSQVRHPNIVQFLGVFFQSGIQIPILVMEFLPTNLTYCIQRYGLLPKELNYSILYDVVLGLHYLHSRSPPIIHRDLSSNNILLTPNMTAKISDLGVARMLNLTPLQVSRMTGTPGTPAYMPPEVMVANPKYDASVDEFSYGILMIHILSGEWPEPQVGPNRTASGSDNLIPVTEAERRERFLQIIGTDHPLMSLILKCIHNIPKRRAHSIEIVSCLSEMVSKNHLPFTNKLEMLRCIYIDEEEKKSLREEGERKAEQVRQAWNIVSHLREEAQVREEQRTHEIANLEKEHGSKLDSLKLAHSVEVKSLQRQVFHLTNEAEVTRFDKGALKAENAVLTSRLKIHQQKLEKDDPIDELYKLTVENARLRADIAHQNLTIITLKDKLTIKEAALMRKDDELQIYTTSSYQKDRIISDMNWQFNKIRKHLLSQQQSPQATITWKKYPNLPSCLETDGHGVATILNGKICYGFTRFIWCYDYRQDNWTKVTSAETTQFGLGHIDSKLVVIGGCITWNKKSDKVYTWMDATWKKTIPPMPTARSSPGVLSLDSALIVAAGSGETNLDCIEIYELGSLQWSVTSALPSPCFRVQLVLFRNTCYAIGGVMQSNDEGEPMSDNHVYSASVDNLFQNAVLADQTTDIADNPLVWTMVSVTPTYAPAVTTLAGSLVALGGDEKPTGGIIQGGVYVYSPSTTFWMNITELPVPLAEPIAVPLSSTDILVIGGPDIIMDAYIGTVKFKL